MATQILVIFIIRTAQALRDRPHPALVASSLSALAVAVGLPYSPLAQWFGFVPLSANVIAAICAGDCYLSDRRLCSEALVFCTPH
jgi:Mg2+-importing ATPase